MGGVKFQPETACIRTQSNSVINFFIKIFWRKTVGMKKEENIAPGPFRTTVHLCRPSACPAFNNRRIKISGNSSGTILASAIGNDYFRFTILQATLQIPD